jgi:hypothetical protein
MASIIYYFCRNMAPKKSPSNRFLSLSRLPKPKGNVPSSSYACLLQESVILKSQTRNIAFLMDQNGRWSLSPAFDVMWTYRPQGRWINTYQIRVNGKQDDFKREDLLAATQQYGIKDGEAIVDKVGEVIRR